MRVLRAASVLAIVLAVLFAAFLVVNQFDEELPADVADYFRSGRTPPLEATSGFAMIVGLAAPIDAEPRAWALEWARTAAKSARERRPFRTPRDMLGVKGARELLCRPDSIDCVRTFRANPASVREMALDNAPLLKRYAALQAETELGDAGIFESYDTPVAHYATLLDSQSLVLSQIAVQAASGDVDGALGRLEADAAFQRRWLSQARGLISKMVAVRTLSRDVLLGVQISREVPGLTPRQWQSLRRIATPLTRADTALRNSLRFEAAMLPDLVDRTRAGRAAVQEVTNASPAMAHLMTFALPHATLRHAHRRLTVWEDLDQVDTRDIPGRLEIARRNMQRLTEPDWSWFYNPGGKMLSSAGAFDYGQYVLRVRDLDALVRLACAVMEIRERQVQPEAVVDHLSKNATDCRDPYSGQPMAWDPVKKELWFRPRSPGTGKRFGGTEDRVLLFPY